MRGGDFKWRIDTQHWPVLVVHSLAVEYTDEEHLRGLEEVDAVLDARPEPYSIVLNQGHAISTPRQRETIAAYMRKNEARDRTYRRRAAFVVETLLVQGQVQAQFWHQRPVGNVRTFNNLDDAIAWCREAHVPPSQ